MNDKVHHIRKRFHEKKDSIDRLLEKNSEFRALCEDYNVCVKAFAYWTKSQDPEAETRRKEYRTLIRELEEEVTQTLETLEII